MGIQNTRGPQLIEEYIVAALQDNAGCAPEGGAVMPPPETCPDSVHSAYWFAQSHILTILIVVVFIVLLIQMIVLAINPNAGGH